MEIKLLTFVVAVNQTNGLSCADPDSFVRGSPTTCMTTLLLLFLFMTGEEEKVSNATILGPSSAHLRNAIKCVSLGQY